MLPSLTLFYALLAVCAAALVWRCFVVDRVLAAIVVAALVVNLGGAAAMGWWARTMHGREYTAGDEIGYQWEGQRLLRAWRTGDTSLVRTTVGIYAPINAAVILVAGPGQTQMRVLTGLVGAVGVGAVYWLALLLFRSPFTARIAAAMAAASPVLILYSWANLRDRWIGVAAVVALVAILRLMERWSWSRLLMVALSLALLGELRHYWAALLGWLAVATYVVVAEGTWTARLLRVPAVVVAVGLALWVATGSFLAYSMRGENARRYVTAAPSTPGPSGNPVAVAGAPQGAAGSPSTAAPGNPPAGTAPPEVGNPGGGPPVNARIDSLERPPFSGETMGEARAATPPANAAELLRNVAFVLFGRVHGQADRGQYAAKLLLPEAIGAFALLPLAVIGFAIAFLSGRRAAIIPAAYIAAIIAILSWLRGDDWNTFRFRGLYWSVLLVFAAGGIAWAYHRFHGVRQPMVRT